MLLKHNIQLKPKLYQNNATSSAASATFIKQTLRMTYQGSLIKVCICLVLNSKSALACWGGGSYYDWHLNKATQHPYAAEFGAAKPLNVTGIKDFLDRNIKTAWGGWTPPPKVQSDWKKWVNEWQLKNNNTDYFNKKNKDKFQKERGAANGWPVLPGWQDLGEGHGGAAIPPWAYIPKYTGKPSKCLISPRYGDCKGNIQKWGYNPYTDKCEAYTWSGCGGNQNKFDSKLKCEEHCTLPPPPSCAGDSGIPRDYTITYDQ